MAEIEGTGTSGSSSAYEAQRAGSHDGGGGSSTVERDREMNRAIEQIRRESAEDAAETLAASVERLNESYGADASRELLQTLAEDEPRVLAEALPKLNNPLENNIDADARRAVAAALGDAFDNMNLANRDAFANDLARAAFNADSAALGQPSLYVAEIVAASGSSALGRDYTEAGLTLADTAFKNGAGTIGGLERYVSTLGVAAAPYGEAVDRVVAHLKGNALFGDKAGDAALQRFAQTLALNPGASDAPGETNALSRFVEGAAKASPRAGLDVFKAVANSGQVVGQDLMEFESVAAGMSKLFTEQQGRWTGLPEFQSDGYIQQPAAKALTSFFQHALFNPELAGDYRQELMKTLGNFATDAAVKLQNGQRLSGTNDVQDGAKLLGGIFSAISKGYDKAAGALEGDRKARADAANFVVGLAFAFVPGGGAITTAITPKVAQTAASFVYDQIKDGLKTGTQDIVRNLVNLGVPKNVADQVKLALDQDPNDYAGAFRALGLPAETAQNIETFLENNSGLPAPDQLRGLVLQILPDGGSANLEGSLNDGYDETERRINR